MFPIISKHLTFDLGAGIFVTTVVAGSIAVVRPFKAMERPFLRDVIFYMSAVFFTFYVLYDKKITLAESLGKFSTHQCFAVRFVTATLQEIPNYSYYGERFETVFGLTAHVLR